MCSQNCIREFEKLWRNSLQTLFLAITAHNSHNSHESPSTHFSPSTSSLLPNISPFLFNPSFWGNSCGKRKRRNRNQRRKLANKRQNELLHCSPNSMKMRSIIR